MSMQTMKLKDLIKIKTKLIKYDRYFDDDKEMRNIYRVFVYYHGNQISFTFGDSIHNTQMGIEPDIDSLLETITSDYYYTKEYYPTFSDFCSEFGYDTDSRKAEKAYRLCLIQGNKLHKLFNEQEIEQLREELEVDNS